MAQGEFGHRLDIHFFDSCSPTPGTVGARSAQPHQVGAQAVHAGGVAALGNPGKRLVIQGNVGQGLARRVAALAQLRLGLGPVCADA